jgi:tetratricopeptide (TPR) repeat protein
LKNIINKLDLPTYSTLSGYINQENRILSKQADDAIKKLPRDQVSSTDYLAVGLAAQNSRNFDVTFENFKKALDAATSLDDEVDALRNLASLEMVMGHTGDARANYQKALDIFAKYPRYDDFTKNSTTVYTELAWGWSEAGARNLGNYHLDLPKCAMYIRQASTESRLARPKQKLKSRLK